MTHAYHHNVFSRLKYDNEITKLSPNFPPTATTPLIKLEAGPESVATILNTTCVSTPLQQLSQDPPNTSQTPRPVPTSSNIFSHPQDDDDDDMSDGRNEARAMRILEVMNDFRTLQHHVSSLITRSSANPPDQESYYLDGYVVLRQCNAESQAILASHYNPGNLGLQAGSVPETEVQKATLQRIILDSSTRRFQAHKIYLRASAAMRWVSMRQQLLRGQKPSAQHSSALRRIDQHLRQELNGITDDHVMSDLRGADRRKGYWIDEDPSLERMLQWIRMQR